MINILNNPSNKEYELLIDYASKICKEFILVIRNGQKLSKEGQKVFQKLNPYLKNSSKSKKWPGTETFGPPSSIYYYALNEETKDVLIQYANSLYSWVNPKLPEDLCFIKTDKSVWLYNVAHEKISWIENENESDLEFIKSIPGLKYSID
ncbi:stage III sporulation protein AH [Tepidibacter mesophilus]|uniref:stage III sporulation protein AH n=1 Tax=Tepidibacter mesophilus TaxID=655607 RepID=UPI000C078F4E|nr:stage III sporulation protein AH [Tepidibacter mesophilus]